MKGGARACPPFSRLSGADTGPSLSGINSSKADTRFSKWNTGPARSESANHDLKSTWKDLEDHFSHGNHISTHGNRSPTHGKAAPTHGKSRKADTNHTTTYGNPEATSGNRISTHGNRIPTHGNRIPTDE